MLLDWRTSRLPMPAALDVRLDEQGIELGSRQAEADGADDVAVLDGGEDIARGHPLHELVRREIRAHHLDDRGLVVRRVAGANRALHQRSDDRGVGRFGLADLQFAHAWRCLRRKEGCGRSAHTGTQWTIRGVLTLPPSIASHRIRRRSGYARAGAGAGRGCRAVPLRLFAAAAGHAREPALVVCDGRIHEHGQRRRLPVRALAASPIVRRIGLFRAV